MKKDFSDKALARIIKNMDGTYNCGITDTAEYDRRALSRYSNYFAELNYSKCTSVMKRYDSFLLNKHNNAKRIIKSIFTNVQNRDRIDSIYIQKVNTTTSNLKLMIRLLSYGINPNGGNLDLSFLMKMNRIFIKKTEDIEKRKKESDFEFEKNKAIAIGYSIIDRMPMLYGALKSSYCMSADSANCDYYNSEGEMKQKTEQTNLAKQISEKSDTISKWVEAVGKATKSDEIETGSDFLKYFSEISALFDKDLSGADAGIKAISAGKTTLDTEIAIYKYLEKSLKYTDAEKFYERYGKAFDNLKYLGSELSLGKSVLESIKTFNDPNSSRGDKINSYVDVIGKSIDLTVDYAVLEFGTEKAVQKVTDKTVVSKGEKVFKLTEDSKKFVDNAAAVKNIVDVSTSTIKGGISRWEITQKDGYQPIDVGETVVGASTEGLSKVLDKATLGIITFDGTEMTDFMIDDIKSQNADNNIFVNIIANTEVDNIGDALVVGGAVFLETERVIGDATIKFAKDTYDGAITAVNNVCDWVRKVTGNYEDETITIHGKHGGGGYRY